MGYKLRLVVLKNGLCRIQKRHWLMTLNFWCTLTCEHSSMTYWTGPRKQAIEFIKQYENNNESVLGYEEIK